MLHRLPLRGTLLNSALVVVGALLGLALGNRLPTNLKDLVIPIIGFCNMLFAVKMFLKGDNVLLTIASAVIGGIIGAMMGIDVGLDHFATWAHQVVGGGGKFNEAVITTSVLYCVGPMTIMGCLDDGIRGNIDLLKIKSVMDGISAVLFAAALGSGVLVTAGVILVFQGALTLLAKPLHPLTKVPGAIEEMGAVGGVLLLAMGVNLVGLGKFPVAILLPALVIAPMVVVVKAKFKKPTASA